MADRGGRDRFAALAADPRGHGGRPLLSERRAGNMNSPDRAGAAEPPRLAALNMGPTVGWDAYQPYINLVKGTIDNWSQPFVDGNGEVLALPPGRTIAMNVWFGFGGPYQKVKTGRYVVKWSGGALTVTKP